MYEATIFDLVGNFLSNRGLEALGGLLMIVLTIFIRKEILPLLQVRRNRELAEFILVIADDVTDYFRLKFPSAHWSVWLDKAVERIIEITGVNRDVADRAIKAAVARKGEILPMEAAK
jgi:hypothetical protein